MPKPALIVLAALALVVAPQEAMSAEGTTGKHQEARSAEGTTGTKICRPGVQRAADETCVVDGDTVWLDGEKIRIANIDAPECYPRCAGDPSTLALARILSAGRITITRTGGRSYDRTLARIFVNGKDIAEAMIAGGWAERH